MLRAKFIKYWPFLAITFVIFAFFFKLFWPLSIFITPDYGRSDSWHLSIANKYYLSQELKKNHLPIWNPSIGTGYPTLAEGQTGIFFLPNLLLFRLLPFVLAYNLNLVVTFLIAALGTYLFARSLNLSKLPATYAGLVFALGGFFVVHVQHLHLIQTAALTPLLFWCINEFFKKGQFSYLLILSLVLSQQLFAGFPQLVFYSLVALLIYAISITLFKFQKSAQIKLFLQFTLSIILGFLLSAIQVMPTYQFLNLSSRQSDPRQVLSQFPYKPVNLLQFLDPFILGSPKDATYQVWTPGKWGIFWENTAYIGILPLSLALVIIAKSFVKRTRKLYLTYSLTFLIVISTLLALGDSAPLHPVFSFPPFSIFRVPSRFLLITQFALVMLSAIYLQKLKNRKIITALIFALSIANLFWTFFLYNPVDNAKKWFGNPQTANYLLQVAHQRIYSTGHPIIWNKFLLTYGWQDNSYYFFARNSLDQNSNLIFGISQFGAYESLTTQRQDVLASLILNNTSIIGTQQIIPKKTAQLLAFANVSHIITPYEIKSAYFEKKFEIKGENGNTFKVFEGKIKPQRVFVTNKYTLSSTIPGISQKMAQFDLDPQTQVVLEKDPQIDTSKPLSSLANIKKETSLEVEIDAYSSQEALLILADSYYPGWEAYVNDEKTPIFAANINARAVIIPAGKSTITFRYQPQAVQLATLISSLSLLFLAILFLKSHSPKVSGM